MTTTVCKVAIIGAGPYGMAAAAHLRAAGVETCVFGEPMEFWETQMPKGMCLRSPRCASHIADPSGSLTLEKFEAASDLALPAPLPLEAFVRYGRWFARQAIADIDRRRVLRIDPAPRGFRLALEDGSAMEVERVVVAAGISPFPNRIPELQHFPCDLVSHSADHRDLAKFAGRRVLVIGGGQSALESAALLSEAGAEVEVVARAPQIHWLGQRFTWLKSPANPLRPLLYRPTDVGPPGLNLINSMPGLFRRLPRDLQDRIAHRSIRPAGAPWLVSRLRAVTLTPGRSVTAVKAVCGKLHLNLDDGTDRHADHLLQATGYKVDVSRYPFLPPQLLVALRTAHGYPVLGRGFEASLPGLHFLGAPAAYSFGPLCRFVSGSGYTARALTLKIASKTNRR